MKTALDFPKLNAAATRFGDRLGSMDFNNLAWGPALPQSARDPGTRDSGNGPGRPPTFPQEGDAHAVLNTVAAVYATVGRCSTRRAQR